MIEADKLINARQTDGDVARLPGHQATGDDSAEGADAAVENELLSAYQDEAPLIPNDVAVALLRIHTKFLNHHSCLCTSRFRHILHQLDQPSHQKLDSLCSKLQTLTLDSDASQWPEDRRNQLYQKLVCFIFQPDSLMAAYNRYLSGAQLDEAAMVSAPAVQLDQLRFSLQAILTRLVSEYRAIFTIETECAAFKRSDDDGCGSLDHEHRKRHEEEDSCPEEIKLMKVAYDELSLECQCSELTNACTRRPDSPAKSPLRKSSPDKDHHIHRYYSLVRSQHKKSNNNHSTRDPNHPHRHWHQQTHSHSHRSLASALCCCPPLATPCSSGSACVHSDKNAFSPDSSLVGCKKAIAQRKRKDRRDSSPEKAQDIKCSRSSSELFDDEARSEARRKEKYAEMIRRSKSFTAVPNVQMCKMPSPSICTEDSCGSRSSATPPSPFSLTKRRSCTFYVSDDDLSSPGKTDTDDCNTSPNLTEDSNGSLVGNFDRHFMLYTKRPVKCARSRRTAGFPKTSSKDKPGPLCFELPAREETCADVQLLGLGIKGSQVYSEDCSSIDSNPSSPSTISSSSNYQSDEENNDDDVTLKEDDPTNFERLRRNSCDSEPELDHQQQLSSSLASGSYDNAPAIMPWLPSPAAAAWRGERTASPLPSETENEFRSTRHFRMIHSQNHLDPSHIARTGDDDSPRKSKLKHLNKQLKSVKKKILQIEIEFENQQGYRPSQADKWKNEDCRLLMTELSKLKRQIQTCKDSDFGLVEDGGMTLVSSIISSSEEIQSDVEDDNSKSSSLGSTDPLLSSRSQQQSPQLCVGQDGEPVNPEDHSDSDNASYIFHQSQKRVIRRASASVRLKENVELETIPEDLEIPLTLASPQHRISIEVPNTNSIEKASTEARPAIKYVNYISSKGNEGRPLKIIDENLHAMSRYELLELQRRTREEKKLHRRNLKEKEERFLKEQGLRRISKEERCKIDETSYNLYKKAKAQLKLIEALLSKGRQ